MLSIDKNIVTKLLEYDPSTGTFRWKVSRGNGIIAGDVAGTINKKGYRKICINRVNYFASRLAWIYMTGCVPTETIDHKDRNPSNDKWDNLREATRSENQMNRRLPSHNTSGAKGVIWSKERNRWKALIRKKCKQIFLGYFDSIDEAKKTYWHAANKYHNQFSSSL